MVFSVHDKFIPLLVPSVPDDERAFVHELVEHVESKYLEQYDLDGVVTDVNENDQLLHELSEMTVADFIWQM